MEDNDHKKAMTIGVLEMLKENCRMPEEFSDGYYVAYKPITLSCILFMFIEMKFIHCHSCVMFAMKSMSMCNDYVNYDEIII